MFPLLWVVDKVIHALSQDRQAEAKREELLQNAEHSFRNVLTEQIDSLRDEVHKMRSQLQLSYKHLDDCYAANGELRQLNAELRIEVVNLKAIVGDLRLKIEALAPSPTVILPPGL